MLRRMKKSSAFLLVILMVISVFGTAAASADVAAPADTNPYIFVHDSDTPYWHRSPHRINSGTPPAVYHLVTGGVSLPAYCCDIETSIAPGTAYKRINLEDAGYYTEEAAAHIRFILANGFWVGRDNLAELETAAGVSGLTAAEALTATQAAIWNNANADSISDVYAYTGTVDADRIKDTATVNPAESADDDSEARILAVFNYLCSGTLTNTSTVANFTGEQVVLTILNDLNSYDVTVKFGLKGTFTDAGSLELQAALQNGTGTIASGEFDLLGADALTADADGLYTITFKAVDAADLAGAKVNLKINGTQTVQDGIYFYEPEGGRNTAQCFVGYGEGETPVLAEADVNVELGQMDVGLEKVDASLLVNGECVPMEGVEFDLYVQIGNNPAVKYPGIETAKTDADGKITWTGLVAAANVTYSYKEVVPAGYTAVNGEGTLTAGEPVVVQNCHTLGDLEITKKTPNMAADSVNADRHYQFEVKLNYGAAQILQNSREWPTVEVLEDTYGTLDASYANVCEDSAAPADPNNPKHPGQIVLTKEGNGIMGTVVELAGGETLVLTGIPAGAAYTVTELDAEGAPMEAGTIRDFNGELLAADKGAQIGTIPAGNAAEVVFSNYVYDETEIDIDDRILVLKNLDGKPSTKAFQFTLTDVTDPADRRVVETKANGVDGAETGKVNFAPIAYTKAGTYTYEVHEELTYGYICDDRVYTVVVTVEQNDVSRKLEVASVDVFLPKVTEVPADPAAGTEAQTIVTMELQDEILFENKTVYYDEDDGYTSLAVKKVWKLDDGGTAADAVTVNLLKNGEVYETVTLNAANNWSKSWYLLDDDYQWTVEEVDVPEGFTVSMTRTGLTWTLVNDDWDNDDKEKEDEDDGGGGTDGGDSSETGGGDEEEIILIDEDVPLADVPKTGENLIAEILCIASGLVLAVLMVTGKKRVN